MFLKRKKTQSNLDNDIEEKEIIKLLEEAQLDPQIYKSNVVKDEKKIHPAVVVGLTGALLAHAAILFSLPPVIKGKGAPFLPTAKKGIETMFQQIRLQPQIKRKLKDQAKINGNVATKSLRFVDLGSGDGRVVFSSAREGLFYKSIGYEINPVLHIWAMTRRLIQAPLYWSKTNFYMQDLWSVDLSEADVVAVYGLHPIMTKLGGKMENELKTGALVVSNVFIIPGWKTISSINGVHIYSIPESLEYRNRSTLKP
mmetsp:Transcript_22708/g.25844  ORF Transcript_22708/g.25844 Transcript_22708/m.25844 type:complete len:255 (-) Transcript_22708:21-785(-)